MMEDANNDKKEDARSQIEKIRFDLEKKLAALEAAKINSEKLKVSGVETPKDNKEITGEETSEDDSKVNKGGIPVNKNQDSSKQVSQENTGNKIENDDYDSNKLFAEESAFFEINDEIKDVTENRINNSEKNNVTNKDRVVPVVPIVPLVKETQIKQPIKEKSVVIEKKENKENEEKKKVLAKTSTVIPIVTKNVKKEPIIKQNEEPEKKSGLNKIIYVLGAVIVMALGYLAWSFLGGNSDNKNENNKILSEYENRRYKDSIELADANNLLLDYESQHYIDSIALANQVNIISNPNSRNTPVNNALRDRTNNTSFDNTSNTTIVGTELNNDDTNINSTDEYNDEGVDDTVTTNSNDLNNNNDATLENPVKDGSLDEQNKEVTPDPIEVKKIPKKAETLTSIEKSPVYPGCEKNKTEKLKKKCFISKISKFVSSRFNSDLSQDLGLDAGVKRINVSFVIDKSGNVNVLKVRAQHKTLEKEALRVVNSLPKMKAGKKKGKSEPVYYNLPIVYKVEN